MFEELRRPSAGGVVDYAGITWERLEAEDGVFWPCPSEDHPGTPRLFEDLRFDAVGRAGSCPTPWRPPAEETDEDYPIWFTTGRVVSHYLSGEQTRRIGQLVDQYRSRYCELHPRFAEFLGVADGDIVRVTSRRGSIELPARVTTTIRPDTVFIPYHWAGRQAANQLTNPGARPRVEDPRVQGVRRVRVEADVERVFKPGPLRHRPEPLHRLPGLRAGLRGVRHPPGPVDDPPRRGRRGPAGTRQTAPTVCMHCTDPTCAEVCPADAIKQDEDGVVQSALEPRCIACSNCVIACPFGVPKMMGEIDLMMKCDLCLDRTSVGGKPMCASVCPRDALWYGTPDEFAATRRGRLGARVRVRHRR